MCHGWRINDRPFEALKNTAKSSLRISVLLNWDKSIKDPLCSKPKTSVKTLIWLHLAVSASQSVMKLALIRQLKGFNWWVGTSRCQCGPRLD